MITETVKQALMIDEDFIQAYKDNKQGLRNIFKRWFLIGFEQEIDYTLDYCFNDYYFNPYLDKRYLDIANMVVEDKIINLDDIYECFINNLEEQ